jgi:hypothetical protein
MAYNHAITTQTHGHVMFVRFRQQPNKLQVSLVHSTWNAGKLRQEHIAGLGSVPLEPTVPDRVRFWKKLFEKLSALSNRIDQDTHYKVLDSISKRIPMVTQEELRASSVERYERQIQFWEGMQSINGEMGEGYRAMRSTVEQKAAAAEAEAAKAASHAAAMRKKAEMISRGELPPELLEEIDVDKLLAETGTTKRQAARWVKLAEDLEFAERDFQKYLKAIGAK